MFPNCKCLLPHLLGSHRYHDDSRYYGGRRMSEEREPHAKKNAIWMEKPKERSLYSDRPRRPHRLGGIHKRLGRKVESNDDQIDENCDISLQQTNNTPTDNGGRNPFRSVGSTYRSIAAIATPETMANQSTADEKDSLQLIKVKVEMLTPAKPSVGRDAKRNRDSDEQAEESESQSDDVAVIQSPAKRQKINDTIDLGMLVPLSAQENIVTN